MKEKSIVVAILIMVVSSSIVYAETAAEKAEKENQSVNNTEKASAKNPKKPKRIKEFIPSEEISIDKPVAFPVDI